MCGVIENSLLEIIRENLHYIRLRSYKFKRNI